MKQKERQPQVVGPEGAAGDPAAARSGEGGTEAERYRRLFEEDPTAAVVATGAGSIVACNGAFARLFALESAGAARGASLLELEGGESLAEAWRRMQAGEQVVGELVELWRGGRGAWVRATLVKAEEAAEVRGYLQDVTAHHAREGELERRLELMRLVEAATQDVVWEWDLKSGVLAWNNAGPRRFRYTASEMRPCMEWHADRIHPQDRDRVLHDLDLELRGMESSWMAEYRFRRGDGSYATVLDRAHVVRDDRGEPVRVVGWMQDITSWREAEEVQRLLAQIGALLESTIDVQSALTAVAGAAVPVLCDRCLIDLFDADGSLHRKVCHPDDETGRAWSLEALAELGSPALVGDPMETLVRRREPILLHLAADSADGAAPRSIIVVPITSGERVLGLMTFLGLGSGRRYRPVDLIAAQEVAMRTALAVEHARRYEAALLGTSDRETLLRLVAHDLRNPLQALTNSLTLLDDFEPERRAENRRWIEIANRAAQQMEHLLNDLLDVSSISAGRFTVNPDAGPPEPLLDSALELLKPLAEAKELRMESDVEPLLPPVRVDAKQFLRVLANLLGNAVKFTEKGGAITLRGRQRDGGVEFSVTDTGPGIPAEELPYVFTDFWQGRKGDRRGAGLGLPIAKGIVEAHGGRIWVESEVGRGTTFYVSLPAGGAEKDLPRRRPKQRRTRPASLPGEPPSGPEIRS